MSTSSPNDEHLDQLFHELRISNINGSENFNDQLATYIPDPLPKKFEDICKKYLSQPNTLPWELLDLLQDVPKPDFMEDGSSSVKNQRNNYDFIDFVKIPEPLSRTSYHFKRKGIDGKIFQYNEEVNLSEVENANAANCLNLNRKINREANSLKGSTSQLPFTPGGVTMSALQLSSEGSKFATATKLLHRDAQGLFDIPQGMQRGIIPDAPAGGYSDQIHEVKELDSIDNEDEKNKELITLRNERKVDHVLHPDSAQESGSNKDKETDLMEIDRLLPMGIDFGRIIRDPKATLEKKRWAHVVDLSHRLENFDILVPKPARTWPFELDIFQQEAIYHLEKGDSVFVAAHTSAGKTVVAEYAIAMSQRNMTKVIYTSPIKALSNQKFRDFKEDFDDVEIGLLTGDVQINPTASCLIMTTEILRSMLYRGADLIRDLEFVIFDEVHYVNDQDRGVVWEEVIIMLPSHVKFILLSATVPNTFEFADWIGRTKQKNIYVISTPKRPVPLEINIWATEKMIPVVNENREFSASNFKKHVDLLKGDVKPSNTPQNSKQWKPNNSRTTGRGGNKAASDNKRITSGARGPGARGSNRSDFFRRDFPNKQSWSKIVNYLKNRELLPAVIFVFSKKNCEDYAESLVGMDFATAKEKSQIYMFIEKSISRLKKEDRELPQILKMRSFLERCIAVHHGGMLPIVKELVEMLFAKGYVKVLFATETFAMGLNLPTRTVVFSAIEKHDGNSLRYLNPGEFTQMAGRAGRRGKDKVGTVILMTYKRPIEEIPFKEVTLGQPTRLKSQFRLTYNMILNLLRIEALKVEEMIKYSFGENTKQNLLPEHAKKAESLQDKLMELEDIDCKVCADDIETAIDLTIKIRDCNRGIINDMDKNKKLFRLMKPGKLTVYRDTNGNAKLGSVLRIDMSSGMCSMLCFTKPSTLRNGQVNHLPYLTDSKTFIKKHFQAFSYASPVVDQIPFHNIELLSKYVVNLPLHELINKDKKTLASFHEKVHMFFRLAPKLKETNMDKEMTLAIQQFILDRKHAEEEFFNLKCIGCEHFAEHFSIKYQKHEVTQEIKNVVHLMSDQNLSLLPDYEQRLAVLRECEFIDPSNNVLLKGRVACEINSGYELVLTELILDNFLGDFEPEEIVALLSAFVYEGRTKEEEPLITTPRLAKGKKRIAEIYERLLKVYETHQVPLTKDEAEFLEKKRFALMNVVYEWARGLSFKEIMSISVEAEGTIVRVITRLDEICREVKLAASIIGYSTLHMKMSQAQELIKRDIVFAASLYL
ncbi:HCL218Cp [Eremothecium sinecaudum]|uniref:HCL218Cp n=1 Tax=Eremothecium sinecaudum TaxID=45286 RepID=A0A109UYE3_9SACH|nr:HCL218Cp [Eremothecium sinecaudum]AMD19933.1 HCL218Cp [Eremothecium sinecaudum]